MISVGFSQGQDWYSKVILAATGGICSHTFLALNVTGNPNLGTVVQASGTGIVQSAESDFRKQNKVVAECNLRLTVAQEVRMATFAHSQLGDLYDWAGILGFGWVLGNRALGRKVGNPLHEAHAYVCSAFALSCMRSLSLPEWGELNRLDVRTTTPEDLLTALVGLATRCDNITWRST